MINLARDWPSSSGSLAEKPSSTNDAAAGGYQNRALGENIRREVFTSTGRTFLFDEGFTDAEL